MLLSLSNVPRDYAWGSTTLLAGLEGRTPTGGPEAEVWFGDHPGDPADLVDGTTLDAVTQGTLPYLLKVLAAGAPLSIQVHPTIAQAREGWAKEGGLAADDPKRNYRDANHKPELIVALSARFEALSGLRPVDRTLELLDALPQNEGLAALRARLEEAGESLREVIGWLLSGDARDEVDDIIAAIDEAAARASGADFAEVIAALSRIAAQHPGDPGVVVALLMNYVVLARGEGIFLRAGLLHAYVAGLGVEIMAASDNVLRGGLTPKHIDVPELLAIVDARPAEVPILRAEAAGAITAYPVDISDFALRRIELTGTELSIEVSGPSMLLATAGEVSVSSISGGTLSIPVGAAVFATADEGVLTLRGRGEIFFAEPGH